MACRVLKAGTGWGYKMIDEEMIQMVTEKMKEMCPKSNVSFILVGVLALVMPG